MLKYINEVADNHALLFGNMTHGFDEATSKVWAMVAWTPIGEKQFQHVGIYWWWRRLPLRRKQAEPRFLRYNVICSNAGTEKGCIGKGWQRWVTMQVTLGPNSEYSNSAVNTHCYRAAPKHVGVKWCWVVVCVSLCKLCGHSIQVPVE